MENSIIFNITINASAEKVWDTITNPDKIEQYMFGSRCESAWVPGAKANYFIKQGDKDVTVVKGEVIRSEPHKLLEHTIFPAGSEIEDILENYIVIIYELEEQDGSTELTITQKGYNYVANGKVRYIETQKGWKAVLPKLKEVAEQ
ncbi:SRPBCC family protein [Balneola vulgaris]|uniref:SRPBCC family protein n=1 Tax=Balneola vulgaris TaxID=287535 RepID=UPI0003634786|nr:SRPBCC domain-containing protein [Balneola vulgaris]